MSKYAGYYGAAAQLQAVERRSKKRKLIQFPTLCQRVIEQIKHGWTPEQIAGRMQYEGIKSRVCQETIYRYIYTSDGMKQELWWYLPNHRKYRRPRYTRKKRPSKFHRDVSILFRPDDVAHRRQFGHWEGDLMLFKQHFGQANVTSLVERVSRFTVILKMIAKKPNLLWVRLLKQSVPCPNQPENRSHLIAAQSSSVGLTCRPRSVHNHGFAIRLHLGKKERWKIPIAEREDGYHVSLILRL